MTTAATRQSAPRSIFSPAYRSTSGGIVVLVTLIAFEAMAVAAALPTAARALHGIAGIGWAFTGFLVSDLVGMVVSGQVCDRRGPRLPMIAGLAGFIAGLAIAGTATSMAQLVAGRCVQGFGGGLLITAIYVVLGTAYPDALRPKIFTAISSAWVLPSLLGPVVSGTLSQHASWRWVFLGLIPLVIVGAGLLVPELRRMDAVAARGPLADPGRVLRAVAAAVGVAALAAAGQHPSPLSVPAAVLGVGALAWGLRALLPPGTLLVRPGVSAPVAMRGLFAGAFFGVESMVPLTQTVQHGFGATVAALPLVGAGVAWWLGSWWQACGHSEESPRRRVALIRTGFALIGVAAVLVAVGAQPRVSGWLIFAAWALAGLGAGMTWSSIGVLLLRYTNDADRGADSAALQLSDAVSSALTTGVAGVLVAAAARGVFGYTTAFTMLDLAMAGVAGLGVAVAGRARPPVTT